MATVDLYSALKKDLHQEQTEKISDASYIESFFKNDDSEETSEECTEWLNKVNSSSDDEKRQLILDKIKEQVSEEDRRCIDRIIELLDGSSQEDIITLDKNLKNEFPDINPLAIFQFAMLLMGAGIIQLNNEQK